MPGNLGRSSGLGRPSQLNFCLWDNHLKSETTCLTWDGRPTWPGQLGTVVSHLGRLSQLVLASFCVLGPPGSFPFFIRTSVDADRRPLKLYLHIGSLLWVLLRYQASFILL
ncbi:unnamed protein product [Sphenostylis stenocarpa]|uniref:Uncharacterized protein n=1 Tax=Sphenostylis stenocarpa TaxID=92480 RepID=A0AA87BAG6_9FABA|nr:unnamed protein product [Sphenostylis stenocarpa]